ncbi:M16 family metallopeptidase [Acidobacteriota bacterium]
MPIRLGNSTLFLSFLVLILLPLTGQEKVESKEFQLENGMRIFLYERHSIPLVNFAFAFNIGSKDESEETSGLVHMLEHYVLFRGTEFRTGDEISRQIRQHGAYVNAHTEYDLSVFDISLPSQYVDFALSNQKEILFNLKITQKELDEEKEVILEEINQVLDDPLRYSTSLVYQNLFQNHPYQRPIYGRPEVIEKVTVEQMEQFYRKHFVPSNCALAVVGDFQIDEMEKQIKTVFSGLQGEPFSPRHYERAAPLKDKLEVEKEMDINQAYLVLGFMGPDYRDKDQFSLDLLTEILGRGLNPTLNHPLLERRIYVNTLSMNYAAHKYGGAILIYLILEPKHLKTAKRLIKNYLKTTRNQNYSKSDFVGEERFRATDYLKSAKNGIRFKLHRAQERSLHIATSIARHMHLSAGTAPINFLEEIEKLDSSDLRRVAQKYLTKSDYVVVTITPKEKKE